MDESCSHQKKEKETTMSARSKMLALIGICSILTCMSFGAMSSRTAGSYTKGLALTFQQNRGQAPAPVQFLTQQNGLDVFLNRSEAVFNFHPNPSANGAVLRTTLLGSNSSASVTAEALQEGKINYSDRQP